MSVENIGDVKYQVNLAGAGTTASPFVFAWECRGPSGWVWRRTGSSSADARTRNAGWRDSEGAIPSASRDCQTAQTPERAIRGTTEREARYETATRMILVAVSR